jgi:hypothetical protein
MFGRAQAASGWAKIGRFVYRTFVIIGFSISQRGVDGNADETVLTGFER